MTHTKPLAMDAETLEALRGSIAAWEVRAAGDISKAHWSHCPLCVLFNRPEFSSSKSCEGCPVYATTGLKWCEETPYEEYTAHRANDFRDDAMDAAAREVEFLKSLLPKEALTDETVTGDTK